MFLLEGNELHGKLNTSKYRDYIYERITRNCLPNLPLCFMGKMDDCKILENIQLSVKKDMKSRKTEKTLRIIILLIYVVIVLVWVTSIRVLLLLSLYSRVSLMLVF